MMNLRFFAVICAAVLGGCVAHTGGGGQLSDGRPISGTVTRDYQANEYTFQLLSPEGWTCSGTRGPSKSPTAAVNIPLSCTNGANGNMILTMNQFADEAIGSFALSNGASGSVKFGGR